MSRRRGKDGAVCSHPVLRPSCIFLGEMVEEKDKVKARYIKERRAYIK